MDTRTEKKQSDMWITDLEECVHGQIGLKPPVMDKYPVLRCFLLASKRDIA